MGLPKPRIADQTALGDIDAMMARLPALMALAASVTTMALRHDQMVLEAIGIVMAVHPARTDLVAYVIAMAPHHDPTVLEGGGTAMAHIVVLTVSAASLVTRAL